MIPLDADDKLAEMILTARSRPDPQEVGEMRVPVPDVLLPADQLGTVHFVGIGGAGLSGIARIMLARGITVTGSDAKESRTLDALRALGRDLPHRAPGREPRRGRHRGHLHGRARQTTPRSSRRPGAGCVCCRGRPRWSR